MWPGLASSLYEPTAPDWSGATVVDCPNGFGVSSRRGVCRGARFWSKNCGATAGTRELLAARKPIALTDHTACGISG